MTETDTVESHERLKENKHEVVESIAEETGMTSQDDKQIISETVEEMYIDENFSDMRFQETEELSPSLTDSIKSSPHPSHGVAKITNIRAEDGYLEVKFQVRGTDNHFTRTYNIETEDDKTGLRSIFGTRSKTSHSREEYEKLVRLAEAEINEPSSLKEKTIPIKPESYSNGYKIHYPPESTSIASQISYRMIRFAYNNNLFSYNDEKDDIDFAYTPNKKSWIFTLVFFSISLFTPSVIAVPSLMITIVLFCLLIATHLLYIIE